MELGPLIRSARLELGLSQAALASRAAISLLSVQKLEAGRANPEWKTVTAVLDSLGLSLETRPKGVDWNLLAACGAPLMSRGRAVSRIQPSQKLLVTAIESACREVSSSPGTYAAARAEVESRERKTEALQALLLAVQCQYPKFFGRHFAKSQLVMSVLPAEVTGRLIKLKRQAESVIARFL